MNTSETSRIGPGVYGARAQQYPLFKLPHPNFKCQIGDLFYYDECTTVYMFTGVRTRGSDPAKILYQADQVLYSDGKLGKPIFYETIWVHPSDPIIIPLTDTSKGVVQ
jgi:hypothetical protein